MSPVVAPTYRLEYQQRLLISITEAWDFFSRPENLAQITPQSLNFEITSNLPERMYAGMIVTYRVRPFLGVAVPWISEITQVREPEYFVDEQRNGPYRFWHHQHFFKQVDQSVEMIDLVHYQNPYGLLGDWLVGGVVRRRLERIFSYRQQVLTEMFGSAEAEFRPP